MNTLPAFSNSHAWGGATVAALGERRSAACLRPQVIGRRYNRAPAVINRFAGYAAIAFGGFAGGFACPVCYNFAFQIPIEE